MKKTTLAISLGFATLLSTQTMAEMTIPGTSDLVINLGSNSYDQVILTNAEWLAQEAAKPLADRASPALIGFISSQPAGGTFSTTQHGNGDANTLTGLFDNFAFDTLWATSVYDLDLSAGTVGPAFYDTNVLSELAAAGVPVTSALTVAQLTEIGGIDATLATLASPADDAQIATLNAAKLAIVNNPAGSLLLPDAEQNKITKLAPVTSTILSPSSAFDDEGYGSSWYFTTEFHVDGTISGSQPDYTGGWFDLNFVDVFDSANNVDDILQATFSSDTVALNNNTASVELFFDITHAQTDFFYMWDQGNDATDTATMTDLSTLIPTPMSGDVAPQFKLSFLVNPAVPEADQLVATAMGAKAVRQTTMSGGGQLPNAVSEPSTLAAFGIALIGLAGMSRRRKS
jgi:hypothetical protein